MKNLLFPCVFVMSLFVSSALLADTLTFSTLHNPPLSFEKNGAITGALVEIVIETVKRTDRDAQVRLRPWKRAQKETEYGEVDGCFNIGNTTQRREWAYFNEDALFIETYVLFVRNKDSASVPYDMENVSHLRVGVQRGYSYGGLFQKALDEKRFEKIDIVDTIEQNIKKLTYKRIDFFVGDRVPSLYYLKLAGAQSQVSIIKKDSTNQEFVISTWPTFVAFSKKTVSLEYVKKFNKAFIQLKQDGTYQQIFKKYVE